MNISLEEISIQEIDIKDGILSFLLNLSRIEESLSTSQMSHMMTISRNKKEEAFNNINSLQIIKISMIHTEKVINRKGTIYMKGETS